MRTAASLLVLLPMAFATLGCPPDDRLRALNDTPIAMAVVGHPDDELQGQRVGWAVAGTDAWLDGTASYDPDGRPQTEITYQWSFGVVPEGSALTDDSIVPAEPEGFATFVPDVLGTYRVALVVVDRKDVPSAPAVVVVEATPPTSLSVELTWDTPRVDLDLHLVRPDGTWFGEGDCFSWDPNPNWGSPDLSDDDPVLDADEDGEGAGPYRERIDLVLPEAGTYRVLAHYYLDHGAALGQDAATTGATLTIEGSGEVYYEDLPAPADLGEDDVWLVGELAWPDGGFAPINVITEGAP